MTCNISLGQLSTSYALSILGQVSIAAQTNTVKYLEESELEAIEQSEDFFEHVVHIRPLGRTKRAFGPIRITSRTFSSGSPFFLPPNSGNVFTIFKTQ
jgi:hypothetical protein